MSVRLSLLAILDHGPCYGYQLRAEYERRTGGATVNVGQVYNTLERLERDGLVRKGESDEQGHVFWHITDAGSAEAADWLRSVMPPPRDELLAKIALAATLPGADAVGAVRRQRDAARIRAQSSSEPQDAGSVEGFSHALVERALALRADAEARWLDEVEQALLTRADGPWPLSEETPRRGRPRLDP